MSYLFDLFTKKARKLKIAESNQAKDSLNKPWLATDEGNNTIYVQPGVKEFIYTVRGV